MGIKTPLPFYKNSAFNIFKIKWDLIYDIYYSNAEKTLLTRQGS